MDGTTQPAAEGFDALLAWIEAEIAAPDAPPLSLQRIAARAGLSPYHFSRLFTARTGRSVMLHVRQRRLSAAAWRLAGESGLKLAELALDSGFESQEAFTRAFRRAFGVSPGRFRRAALTAPPEMLMPRSDAPSAGPSGVRVEQLPDLVRRDAFSVAGLSGRFDPNTASTIPDLWTRLTPQLPFPGQAGWEVYGVVWRVNREDGAFNYLAGGRLEPAAALPRGLERKDLAAADYTVFRMILTGGPLHPQIREAMQLIWGELIPASGLVLTDAPDFEVYDGRGPPTRPGAVIDFHVPVKA